MVVSVDELMELWQTATYNARTGMDGCEYELVNIWSRKGRVANRHVSVLAKFVHCVLVAVAHLKHVVHVGCQGR